MARTRAKEAEAVARARAKVVAEAVARARAKVVAEAVARARGEKKYPPLPEAPAGVELPGSWLEHFPHGHYMECMWPVAKVNYPANDGASFVDTPRNHRR